MRDALSRAGRTTRRGVTAVLSPGGLRGTGLEVAWVAAHTVLYPAGFLRERGRADADRYTLEALGPVQRGLLIGDVEAAGTPILLLHGMVDNRSVFTVLRRALLRRGFGRVTTLNYPVFSNDVRAAATRLAAAVEQVCAETGYERLHVVGHSLGGVIARYYVQRMGGDARVHTLVTLGSPHGGTRAASLLPARLCRQLRPGSDLMAELQEPAPGCRTRFLAFWSDLDPLMVPKRSARIDHPDLPARNVLLRGVGHMSLPVDGRVVHEIVTTLAHLDADGSTVTRGVTPIGSASTDGGPPAGAGARPARRPRRSAAPA